MRNEYKIFDDYVEIYITNKKKQNFTVYIDREDFEKVDKFNSWHATLYKGIDSYYVKTTVYKGIINGKSKYKIYYMHRIITDAPKNSYVDHINHDTLDNRKENLRVICQSGNMKNRKGKNSNNKSGYRNVSWGYNKWFVQLQVNGKRTVLGKFDDVHEAGKFAEEMRQKYYGEYV